MPYISDRIQSLCSEYTKEDIQYCEKKITITQCGNFIPTGFLGSKKRLTLLSLESMILEGPLCLAARKIELAATHSISLGLQSRLQPLRIYAPEEFVLVGKAISISLTELVAEPELISIDCDRLTFYIQKEEDFDTIELFKAGIFRTDTEVEVIGPPTISPLNATQNLAFERD